MSELREKIKQTISNNEMMCGFHDLNCSVNRAILKDNLADDILALIKDVVPEKKELVHDRTGNNVCLYSNAEAYNQCITEILERLG